jgi:clan AA aspartic protease (TIGR02281 family)
MKLETRFPEGQNLIVVKAKIWGPRGGHKVSLALDTAASITTLVPEVMDEIGCSVRDGGRVTTVTTANGKERGYTFSLARFAALGLAEENIEVHVFQLAKKLKVDGLLGLNFLHKLNYEVRSAEGRILAERTAA